MSLLKWVRGYSIIALMCLLLIPVNIFQILSLFLLLINRQWFMRFNMQIKDLYCGNVARCALWCGNRLTMLGDAPRRENAIVMANHQSMIDIVLLWIWSQSIGTTGWMKWFAKDILKYIPGMGWGLLFINTILVKRDWAKDANSIQATFAKVMNGKLPTWLAIFPEGTRMKPEKLAASQAYAAKRGMPKFNRVLVPRGKGVFSSLQGLDGHIAAVYDVTIQYEEPLPSLTRFFVQGGFTARLHMKRYDVSQIPKKERDFNQWLFERYEAKEKLLASTLV
jgi:1-acyl-sn-glycerol-3-phosphate acyltransferase